MKISNVKRGLQRIKAKGLIVFDFDGNLTLTKYPMDPQQAA